MQRRTVMGAGLAALGAMAGAPAWAQGRIAGDVRFYCGFPPGGTADLLCRILADAVTPEIGQKVVVESKSGASGFIANETVANAAPDGRTIGLAAMAAMCVAPVMPGPETADQRRHRPDAGRQHRRRLQHAGIRQARAVPQRAGADRAGEEEPRQAELRLGRQRHVAASGGRAVQEAGGRSISCTCPIAAARPPSRTWSRAIAM
jgi:hypothetical protein